LSTATRQAVNEASPTKISRSRTKTPDVKLAITTTTAMRQQPAAHYPMLRILLVFS